MVIIPVPIGLVNISTSPGFDPAFVIWLPGFTVPVTANPYLGSASTTVCPPKIRTPASLAFE